MTRVCVYGDNCVFVAAGLPAPMLSSQPQLEPEATGLLLKPGFNTHSNLTPSASFWETRWPVIPPEESHGWEADESTAVPAQENGKKVNKAKCLRPSAKRSKGSQQTRASLRPDEKDAM